MFRTCGFSWDDTTKTIKCERQFYDYFCKVKFQTLSSFHLEFYLLCWLILCIFFQKHKNVKRLWGVPFPFLDESEKIFGFDKTTKINCKEYVEAADN